jgi:hypothetical protein
MNYWINSNSGDYIIEKDGRYYLHLISRWIDRNYLQQETIELTQSQFSDIKGFLPIKEKKFLSRKMNKYAPTLSDGTKGNSKRIEIPSIQEVRDKRLKELGL